MENVLLDIGGMTCGGCVASVTRVLQALPGVARAEVNLERGQAHIDYDPSRADPADFRKAIESAGFSVA
jgi:copper chaperone